VSADDPQGVRLEGGEPAAVLIAFEEVLVGARAIWSALARSTLSGFGWGGHDDLLAGLDAPSLPQLAKKLAAEIGRSALSEQIEHRLERQLTAQLGSDLHTRPGAIPLLRRLSPAYPLAVTSSAPQELLRLGLQAAGIGAFFAAAVGEGSGRRPMPAPDIHREAARRLGVSPADVVAVEASEEGAGAGAARAAGMRVIGRESIGAAVLDRPLDFDQLPRHGALGGPGKPAELKTAGP
jgi:HAD superfamily hydrolase (TIGR01509 family)